MKIIIYDYSSLIPMDKYKLTDAEREHLRMTVKKLKKIAIDIEAKCADKALHLSL